METLIDKISELQMNSIDVFIPKMIVIVNSKSTLPDDFKLLPMAQQRFGTAYNKPKLMEVIRQIDLISAPS